MATNTHTEPLLRSVVFVEYIWFDLFVWTGRRQSRTHTRTQNMRACVIDSMCTCGAPELLGDRMVKGKSSPEMCGGLCWTVWPVLLDYRGRAACWRISLFMYTRVLGWRVGVLCLLLWKARAIWQSVDSCAWLHSCKHVCVCVLFCFALLWSIQSSRVRRTYSDYKKKHSVFKYDNVWVFVWKPQIFFTNGSIPLSYHNSINHIIFP